MYGDMDENKPYVGGPAIHDIGSVRKHHGTVREAFNNRKVGEYSYSLVHTQECLWVLDLRFGSLELRDISLLGELLTSVGEFIYDREYRRV